MAMPVPTVLIRCGGAMSSRSHLKCQDTSQLEPTSLNASAATHQRSIRTCTDCGCRTAGYAAAPVRPQESTQTLHGLRIRGVSPPAGTSHD